MDPHVRNRTTKMYGEVGGGKKDSSPSLLHHPPTRPRRLLSSGLHFELTLDTKRLVYTYKVKESVTSHRGLQQATHCVYSEWKRSLAAGTIFSIIFSTSMVMSWAPLTASMGYAHVTSTLHLCYGGARTYVLRYLS